MSVVPGTAPSTKHGVIVNATQLVEMVHRPGEHTILGISGQAGAGKTTFSRFIDDATQELGIHHVRVQLDWYFKLSSRQRKAWLNEPGISPQEAAERRDQINWWDFDRLQEDLLALKRGEDIHLRGVYNREGSGELTLGVDLIPQSAGTLFTIEGVAIAHLGQILDMLVLLHVPSWIRFARLCERDSHRSGVEHEERFALTQAFEVKYFSTHWRNFDLFVDHSGTQPVIIPKSKATKERLLEATLENDAVSAAI